MGGAIADALGPKLQSIPFPSTSASSLRDLPYDKIGKNLRPLPKPDAQAIQRIYGPAFAGSVRWQPDDVHGATFVTPSMGNVIVSPPQGTYGSEGKEPDIFAHEAEHIRSLRRGEFGNTPADSNYQYGGQSALDKAMREGKTIGSFGAEQRGQIVQDISSGKLRSPSADYYVNQLRRANAPVDPDPSDAFMESVYQRNRR